MRTLSTCQTQSTRPLQIITLGSHMHKVSMATTLLGLPNTRNSVQDYTYG